MYVARPKGLTAVCVIGLLLSILGVIGLTAGLLWWLAGERFVEIMMAIGPMNPQQTELQNTMMQEIAALQQRWAPVTIAQTILHVVLVVLLFIASVGGLKMREGAGKLLGTTMAFALLFELARIYPNVVIQLESQEISARYQESLMQSGGNPAAARAALTMMKRVQELTLMMTYLIVGGWFLAKIGFYMTAVWYVNRKSVRTLFEPPDPSSG